MSEEKELKETSEKKSLSRRHFLKNTGLAIGGMAIGGGLVAALNPNQEEKTKGENSATKKEVKNFHQALMYFTPQQFSIVEAATERIFPEDENGAGAKKLHVAYFIDHQLAGGWGTGAKEYTQGPFFIGEVTQGYQGHLNRQQIFDIGLKSLDDYSVQNFKKGFAELEASEQDDVLTVFSEGKVELKGISSSYFFNLLRAATLEGAYSDPLYGGNYNMQGWIMKKFPGHQMSYASIIESDTFQNVKPQGLSSQHAH